MGNICVTAKNNKSNPLDLVPITRHEIIRKSLFSHDGEYMVAFDTSHVTLHHLPTNRIKRLTHPRISDVAFSVENSYLFALAGSKWLQWDVQTGKHIRTQPIADTNGSLFMNKTSAITVKYQNEHFEKTVYPISVPLPTDIQYEMLRYETKNSIFQLCAFGKEIEINLANVNSYIRNNGRMMFICDALCLVATKHALIWFNLIEKHCSHTVPLLAVVAVALSHNKTKVAVITLTSLHIFDVFNRKQIMVVEKQFLWLNFTPDDQILATQNVNNEIELIDIERE